MDFHLVPQHLTLEGQVKVIGMLMVKSAFIGLI